MNLIPLGKRIIVEKPQAPAENRSESGLYISPSKAEPDPEAKVAAVGEDVITIKVGETVIYPSTGSWKSKKTAPNT
jgi:co-chaperonin GroES (HSP10)